MSSWGKKLFEGGKNRVIFKSSKREKKRNLSYPGIRIYQLGFRRVILFTSFLPPTLPEKFFTPLIVWNIPQEGRTTFEFEFRSYNCLKSHFTKSDLIFIILRPKRSFSTIPMILDLCRSWFMWTKKLTQGILVSVWEIGEVYHELLLKEKIKVTIYFA